MDKQVFEAVKEILEEQDAIKFTCDEKSLTFTCDQFDTPIILSVGSKCDADKDTNRIHNLYCGIDALDPHYISLMLGVILENLFTPFDHYKIDRIDESEDIEISLIRIQKTHVDIFGVEESYGKFIKTYTGYYYQGRFGFKTFEETCEEPDLDFTNLIRQEKEYAAKRSEKTE